jgi:hypothetical protein
LGERAQCQMFNLRPLEAMMAIQYANGADPNNRLLEENWAISSIVHEAFETARKAAKEKGRTHYPLGYVRIPPAQDVRRRNAHRATVHPLAEIRKGYPHNHPIRIA